MMKMLLLIVTFFALTGCGQSPSQSPPTSNGSSSSWAYKLINWHTHIYKLTSEQVKTVGKQIGSVANYSTVESTTQTGTFSNFFPVGTKIFEISNIPKSMAFAVQSKDGYVKLVNMGAYGHKGNSTN